MMHPQSRTECVSAINAKFKVFKVLFQAHVAIVCEMRNHRLHTLRTIILVGLRFIVIDIFDLNQGKKYSLLRNWWCLVGCTRMVCPLMFWLVVACSTHESIMDGKTFLTHRGNDENVLNHSTWYHHSNGQHNHPVKVKYTIKPTYDDYFIFICVFQFTTLGYWEQLTTEQNCCNDGDVNDVDMWTPRMNIHHCYSWMSFSSELK